MLSVTQYTKEELKEIVTRDLKHCQYMAEADRFDNVKIYLEDLVRILKENGY